MTITQLRLRRFKKFADWSAAFAPGLTVIRGPNEAGKTTLMEALFEGLFRDPGRGEATARLRSWGEQRLGEITIDLQVRGVRYLLRKDLEAGTILLQSEDGRDRLENPRDVQRRLLEWIGLASEAAYRSTAFVAQGDIARVSEDRRLLSTHLSRILSGAGVETVQQALQWLADQRARLTAPPPGGRTLAERIADLRAQQTVLRQRDERMQRHRIELREVTRRLEEVEREAAERTELVRVAKWAADLQRREQALIEEEAATRDYLVRAESLLARLAALDADLAEFSTQQEALIAELFHARRQYLQLESNLQAAGQQAEREERTLEHLATRHHNAMRLGSLGWTLAGSGLIGVVGGGLIVALINFHWIGWALLGIGAGVLLIGMRYRGRISEAGADYRNQEQRVLDLRRRIEVMQRQLAEAQEMVSTRLQAVGGASLEDVERRFSRYMDLLREREEVRASLRQIRGADPRAALETRLREIAEELASVRATMDTLPKAARKGPVAAAEQLEQQARALAAELQGLRERRARLEGVLDELRDRGDEGARLEEEIASLQSRMSRERQALEVVELTMRLLEEARTLSVYPARELLERRAGEYLAMATDRAYGRVAVDERALRPQVWVPSAGAWKDASELSQATSDLLYLCLRLALLDVITAERRPPLFLDEPFAHLDDQRRRAVLPLLAIAARERQVVLFTCWPDYDQVAEKVVVLDRAAVP
ncbi:MAG: AAA family ATPase [Armatimonadota bacterium]|nr:AAA family ATPase [Armatimonadota bacterium]